MLCYIFSILVIQQIFMAWVLHGRHALLDNYGNRLHIRGLAFPYMHMYGFTVF
jgi:hypothetical protein